MSSDLKVPICVTGMVLLVIFCTVASIANGLLLIVLYKDPLKCFRKPIVVYIAALGLLDLLSGCVTGPGVIHNYILCALGRESSSSLDGTKFAAVAAEFTICTANLLAVLLSVERLCAVAFPILYRRKSSVRRSLFCVGCGVFYTLTFTLSGLAGPQWKRTPLRFHMITTVPFVTLIAVNVALVFAIRWQNRKTQYLLEGMEDSTNPSSSESKRRQREKSLAVTTQLVVTCFVISLLPYLAFIFMDLYFPKYRKQDWFFAARRFFLPFVYLNPAMNPLIFNFRLAHFRRTFRLVFMSRNVRVQDIQLTSFSKSRSRDKDNCICWERKYKFKIYIIEKTQTDYGLFLLTTRIVCLTTLNKYAAKANFLFAI